MVAGLGLWVNIKNKNGSTVTMELIKEIRSRVRYIAGPILGICGIVYFTYHAIQGDRGILAFLKLQKQLEQVRQQVAVTELERSRLEQRSRLLSPNSLDADMLEERARLMLNLAGKNDIVILNRTEGSNDGTTGKLY